MVVCLKDYDTKYFTQLLINFQEAEMEKVLQEMSTNISPLLYILAPRAFENMVCLHNTV